MYQWGSLCWIWMAMQRSLLVLHMLCKQLNAEEMYITIK